MSLRRGLDYIALVCQDVASDFENYFRMHLENAKVPPGKEFCTIVETPRQYLLEFGLLS